MLRFLGMVFLDDERSDGFGGPTALFPVTFVSAAGHAEITRGGSVNVQRAAGFQIIWGNISAKIFRFKLSI